MVNKDWLDIAVLEDYLDGKLDAKTMNRVEREALEDPFVAEALAGLSESPKRSLNSISILQKQLQQRISEQQISKKRRVITWQRLSIAAAAAVMFISVSVVFWMKEDNRRKQMASVPKKVDVTIAQSQPAVPIKVQENVGEASTVAASDLADQTIERALAAAKSNTYATVKTKQPAVVAGNAKESLLNDGVTAPTSMTKRSAESLVPAQVADTPKNGKLNEVVVSATAQKSKMVVTGSTAIVSAEDAKTVPIGNVQQLLQGKIAGLNIQKNGDTPSKEIRIRGMSSFNAPAYETSEPKGGLDKFNDYIAKNNRFRNEAKIGQSVILTFTLSKRGAPENIKVLKGLAEQYNQEAIRLLRKGPKWAEPETKSSTLLAIIEF